MNRIALFSIALFASAALAASGCSTVEEDAEADEQHVEAASPVDGCKSTPPPCSICNVPEGRFVNLKDFIADAKHPERKNDPVLQKILAPALSDPACKDMPTSYAEIQKATALQSCKLETRIISERSMYLGTPEVGRALASRTCGNDPSVFFLVDPIHTAKTEIPTDVELLGNNAVDGVFSYYAREHLSGPRDTFDTSAESVALNKEAGIWKFYGTSVDFIENGYDCDIKKFNGACQSKWAQDNGVKGNVSGARCASCHPGGGMIQKELNSPWTYWQTDPGGYTQKHKDVYGAFQNGVAFEGVTVRQNTKWAKKRAEVLAKKSVKELLRPLFCTMDVNLQAGGGRIQGDFLIDRRFGFGPSVQMDPKNYAAALAEINQVVTGDTKDDKLLPTVGGKKFTDTPGRETFMYPERSQLDEAYVAALAADPKLKLGDLINDILFVDFTRPIYSPMRCSLAELAEGITDPSKAKEELIKKLTAKGAGANTAEKAFLLSLNPPTGAPAHQAEVDTFVKACTARGTSDNAGITKDAVRYASHLRQVTKLMKVKLKVESHELGILDFDETVPTTDLSEKAVLDQRFDPTTCTLGPAPK